jgi:hypothetical protein
LAALERKKTNRSIQFLCLFFSYPINTNSGELETGIIISVINFFESELSLLANKEIKEKKSNEIPIGSTL